ncbi:MAG: hypothetical protein WB580_08145 [Candidatus Binataceae bacterium]
MMNCFEARQDFVGFWQSALDGERRRELLAHFKGCSKCDRAFRAFALTAPMLHSGSGGAAAEPAIGAAARSMPQSMPQDVPHLDIPINMNGLRSADPHRAAEILRRASVYRLADRRPSRDWREAAAGLSAVAAAVLLAYFSVAAPSQSFDDALANPDSISETSAQPDTDFLGQSIPTIPAMSSDLAG